MIIKIKKGTEDITPYIMRIETIIRDKIRPLRYSNKLKCYTDELQSDVKLYIKIKH